ncbi:MAG: hypothetical protein IKY35_05470 [Muribaculaceae bacterium]|nr:hypothetical protein [Muribaculaceae bacterium]
MRTNLFRRLQILAIAIISMLSLSSCIIVDDPDYPSTGYDRDLTGMWELSHINGYRVSGYEVNWLDFYGDGWGKYYYYSGHSTYELPYEYYCEYDFDNWLYIHYADGTYAEMMYWFNHNYTQLYLEWYDRGERITYTYQYCNNPYWAPSVLKYDDTRSADIDFGYRPGIKTTDNQ